MGLARLIAAAYFAAARYAVALQDLTGLGAPFWPGAGVTVTGLLLSPRRMWPAIAVAVAVAELGNNLLTGSELVPSLGWALANVVEQTLAAWLIQRWQADGFSSVRATGRFLAVACTAPVAGAAIGALATTVYVSSQPYLVTAGQWVIGDALGILTVVPFGLVVFGRLPAARLRSVEGTLAIATVTIAAGLVFGVGASNQFPSGWYLVLIPMLWAATRLGIAGAAVSLFIVAQLGSALHAFGCVPIAGLESFTTIQAAAQLKLFLATVGAASLLLASRSHESATFQELAAAREQLVAAVSHELRTPLTAIVGFSEVLLHRPGDLDARSRQAAQVIHRNGEQFHLVQILTDLLDNALRHGAPPVGISVHIDHDHTELSVTDHGPGVPAWFIPRLFDDFAQATNGDQRTTLGLGLGLPISRTLAHANSGQLDYRDTAAHGSCFVLRLPTAP